MSHFRLNVLIFTREQINRKLSLFEKAALILDKKESKIHYRKISNISPGLIFDFDLFFKKCEISILNII